MLPDDAEDGGEAEARAFAGFLGREKRLEDAGSDLRVDPAAGVGDGEADMAAGGGFRNFGGFLAGQGAFRSLVPRCFQWVEGRRWVSKGDDT
jgi:hypothetical protein